MKKLKGISFIFVLIVLFVSNISATETKCDMYTVCPIYDKNTKTLKVYGNNDIGQLGVSNTKDYYYKEEAIVVNDLLPNKEKIIDYFTSIDNVVVVTNTNKVYVSGVNNFGQMGSSKIKSKDLFYNPIFLNKYKINRLDEEYSCQNKECRFDELSFTTIDKKNIIISKSNKYSYELEYTYKKDNREHSYTYTYNINNGKLYRKNISNIALKNPSYKGNKNRIQDKYHIENRDKISGKLLYKRIDYSYFNTKNTKDTWKWKSWNSNVYYYKAKYNKDNKLTYRVIKKKNSNNKLTYNAYYKIVDNKIIKKITKNKYYNNSNIFGNKNIKSKIVYTWNSAGQLKSNKNGKAYKVVTKYNKNGKKVSKVKYKYNAKGKAKKVK
ncbi:hypothetical protein OKW22_000569 [Bacilli bacterium PM5-3]|nr:hypothetical protein [Bacilli bacterium PM5-3]